LSLFTVAKFKELKSLGMGNQPNAADPLTDIEINKFYDDNLLDADNPHALQNTTYLNNNYHFGLRGVTEHCNLCWTQMVTSIYNTVKRDKQKYSKGTI
jgi:hypothetical protein